MDYPSQQALFDRADSHLRKSSDPNIALK